MDMGRQDNRNLVEEGRRKSTEQAEERMNALVADVSKDVVVDMKVDAEDIHEQCWTGHVEVEAVNTL